MGETRQERQLWEGLLAGLPENYAPAWEFAYGGNENQYDQLYALPTTPAQQEMWRAGQLFPVDPDREVTSQGLYTGQVPGAQQLDPTAIPEEMRQDYDIWQQRLQVGQAGEDSFSPLGDQFFGALAALALATGGAAAFGGFAAPAAAGVAEAGAIGPLLETGGAFPALAGGAADVGGSILPLAATPTLTAPAGAATVGGAGAAGATGGGLLGALGLGGGGGGTLATLGDIAGILGPAISGGTSILGAITAADAARDAARTQAGAANDANALLWQMYNQNRADLAPYRQAGYASLGQLAGLVDQPFALPEAFDPSGLGFDPSAYAFTPEAGRFTSTQPAFTDPSLAFTPPSGQQVLTDDPGYQFRVQQGMKALEGSAAARGGLLSGSTARGITNYGQQAASQEYGAAYNRALGRNQLQYGRTQDQYGRELAENELRYGRERGENELRYGRDLGANERNYARGYQYNVDQANRALAQRNLRFRELGDLAGIGQSATGQGVQLGAQLGQQVGGNLLSAGAAHAAGDIGASNALAAGLTGVGNAATSYLQMQYLNNLLSRRQ